MRSAAVSEGDIRSNTRESQPLFVRVRLPGFRYPSPVKRTCWTPLAGSEEDKASNPNRDEPSMEKFSPEQGDAPTAQATAIRVAPKRLCTATRRLGNRRIGMLKI